MSVMFDKDTQKKLKAEYKELLTGIYPNDQKWVDFLSKEADVVVRFDNGFFAEVERQRIDKNFCFGYSDSRYDTEDFDRANRMVEHAQTSKDYFIKKNLENIEHLIDRCSKSDYILFFHNRYCDQKNNTVKGVIPFKWYERPEDVYAGCPERIAEYQELTEKEKALYIEALKQEKALFQKRLATYLKRFGLSKVHAWSYWQDA